MTGLRVNHSGPARRSTWTGVVRCLRTRGEEVEVHRQADVWGCVSLHVCERFLEMLVGCA